MGFGASVAQRRHNLTHYSRFLQEKCVEFEQFTLCINSIIVCYNIVNIRKTKTVFISVQMLTKNTSPDSAKLVN